MPETEKAARLARLIVLQEATAGEINRALIGRDVEVLVEGPARRQEGWMVGRTPQWKGVVFPGPAVPGEVATVRVEGATSRTLTGRACTPDGASGKPTPPRSDPVAGPCIT